jgi:hypothetical protein
MNHKNDILHSTILIYNSGLTLVKLKQLCLPSFKMRKTLII